MENKLKKPVYMWAAAALCCLLWGSAFPAVKTGYKLFNISQNDVFSIILFAGIRFFFAGIITVIIFSLFEKKMLLPKKSSLKKITVLSLFQTVLQYVFFYLGLAFTSGQRGSVINASSVFFAIFISSVIFRLEKLKLNKILGSLIGFAGVILVSLGAFKGGFSEVKGELFILISSISYAFSSTFMKVYSKEENPAMLSGWQFILGGAVMCVFALIFGGRIEFASLKGIAVLIYLSFLSATAYSLWSILLKYNDVSKVAVCSFMIPVFGYILSTVFLSDSGGNVLVSVVSLLLTVIGIIVVNYQKKIYN